MYGKGWRRVVREERELGRWTRKKKRMTGHGREELRVHIGAFSNFYITFVAAPTPRITCYMLILYDGSSASPQSASCPT